MARRIYGISSKPECSADRDRVYVFDTMEEAEQWLHTEEYDFRQREIMSKTAAIRQVGKRAVEEAVEGSMIA